MFGQQCAITRGRYHGRLWNEPQKGTIENSSTRKDIDCDAQIRLEVPPALRAASAIM